MSNIIVRTTLMIICFTFLSFNMFAQSRKLKIEEDGFKWYELYENGKYGAENANENSIIPLNRQYDYVNYEVSSKGWFMVKKGNNYGVCDKNGVELLPPTQYKSVTYENKYGFEYFEVKSSKGKYGICDRKGKEIIPTKYDYITYYASDGYFTIKSKGKTGACNRNGVVLIEPKYESLSYYHDAFGYYDNAFNWVSLGVSLLDGEPIQMDPEGRKLHNHSNGYKWYEIKKDGAVGVLSLYGDTLIPLNRMYESVKYYSYDGGWYLTKRNGKAGACDTKGKEIVAPSLYDDVKYEDSDRGYRCCLVELNGLWGACDENGNEIIRPQYDGINYSVVYGYYEVKKNGLIGACNKNGQEMVHPQFKSLDYQWHTFRYQNESGDWIPLEITLDEDVTYLTEKDGFRWRKMRKDGLCAAQDIKGYAFIKLERQYDEIWYNETNGGWFSVMKNGKMGVCTNSGFEQIAPSKYDISYYCNEGGQEYYIVGINGLYGIVNDYKQEIIKPKYNMVYYVEDYEFYAVQLNGKWGACDNTGKEVVAPIYTDLSYNDNSGFVGQNDAGNWVPLGVTLWNRLNTSTATTSKGNSGMSKEEKINAVIQILGAFSNALQQQNTTNNNSVAPPTYNNYENNVPNYEYAPNNSNSNNKPTKSDCNFCNGTGRCRHCAGRGEYRGQYDGNTYDCSACKGTGRCPVCKGKGYLEFK